MKSIISEVTELEYNTSISIENLLKDLYGEILRWAIVDVCENKLKLCITYEKEV